MNEFKKQVKEKIKLYSNEEYLQGYIRNEFLVDDESANINIRLKNSDDLFDSRTIANQLDLNSEIYDYIDDKSSMLNSLIKLNFHIICPKLSKDEKERTINIIKEHYAIELYKIQKEYKRYKLKIFVLSLLGILFFAVYSLIAYFTKSKLFIEVFGFLFSFTLWEAFESYIYDLSDIKIVRESITQKLLMNIDFEEII